MKKLLTFILAFILCLSFAVPAFAEEAGEPIAMVEETTQDGSNPRVMLTSYSIADNCISPDKEKELEIVIKNYSPKKAISNIKLSLTEDSGDIKIQGTGTKYVKKISANSTYTWNVTLLASKTAQTGEHKLALSVEYEDKYYNSYSASDTICIDVKQTIGLDYDSVQLPAKVTQGNTETISPNLMNTGKSNLRNCKLSFNIDGLESGGVLFIGEIPAGESATGSANLRVSNNKLGEVKGTVTISYEDEFGKAYSKKVDVSTTIEEKKEVVEEQEKKEEKKNPLWWLFLIIGIAAGGAIGFGIPAIIRSSKQRKEDEMRL
ncbi:MAG: hypothetical protein K2F65_04290 [Eubacterium sp.]|nr:hypothetical protein [Eubacterium sp.]